MRRRVANQMFLNSKLEICISQPMAQRDSGGRCTQRRLRWAGKKRTGQSYFLGGSRELVMARFRISAAK